MSVDSARVLVLGDVAVGKSSVLRLLSRGKPVDIPPAPTVGCELEIVIHRYESASDRGVYTDASKYLWDPRRSDLGKSPQPPKDYFIELLEIGASHTHSETRRMFFHDFSGIILVYDLTSPRSCHRLQFWMQELLTHCFDKQDVGNIHSRTPEIVIGGGDDHRPSIPRSVPILIIGTHADQNYSLKGEPQSCLDRFTSELPASEIRISVKRLTDLASGTENNRKLQEFYSNVIETRFFPASLSTYSKPNSPDLRTRRNLKNVAM